MPFYLRPTHSPLGTAPLLIPRLSCHLLTTQSRSASSLGLKNREQKPLGETFQLGPFVGRSVPPPCQQPISQEPVSLPPAPFRLRIISLSYNRPDVHALLSPHVMPRRAIRYADPNHHFSLFAVHERFVDTFNNPVITDKNRTLNSCFSPADRALWVEKRAFKRARAARVKPTYEIRLSFSLRIKDTHKSAVIRKTIRKRWVAALKLVVQYGCRPCTTWPKRICDSTQTQTISTESHLLSLNAREAKFENWLLKDHYYIVQPSLSLHNMTMSELVHIVRAALSYIKQQPMGRNLQREQYQNFHRSEWPSAPRA